MFGNRKVLHEGYTDSHALYQQITLYNLGVYLMSSPQRLLLDLLSGTLIMQSCQDAFNDRLDAQKMGLCSHCSEE